MPYRRAHWALLALFPLIVAAFWPGYFGQLRTVPFALHAHGITATLWLALLAWQNWSARQARLPAHRSVGLLLFLLVPLFAAGGALALQAGIALAAADSDPFHVRFAVTLAFVDLTAIAAFLVLVGWALARRRQAVVHSAAMLATAWLVLPPILGRLIPVLPGLHSFEAGFYGGEAVATLGALLVASLEPRGAGPFRFVAAALAVQILTFETFGMGEAWRRAAYALLDVPPALLAAAAVALAAAVLGLAWRRVPPRAPRRTAPA